MDNRDPRLQQTILELIGKIDEDGYFDGEPGLLVQLADEYHEAGEFDENEHDELVAVIAAHPSEAMYAANLMLRLMLRIAPALNHGCEIGNLGFDLGVPMANVSDDMVNMLSGVYCVSSEDVRAAIDAGRQMMEADCDDECGTSEEGHACTCMLILTGLEVDAFGDPEEDWRGESVLDEGSESIDDELPSRQSSVRPLPN
ncbi:MAG: hypothetical protein ABIG66_03585 [Candidatus Kerfeldbacteria bacterium]